MIEKSLTAGWLISECLCQTPGLPGGASSEEPACQCGAGRGRLSPWAGRCPGGGHGNPLQRSCLGSPMKAGAWRAAVHGAAQSQTGQKRLGTRVCTAKLPLCDEWFSLSLCFESPMSDLMHFYSEMKSVDLLLLYPDSWSVFFSEPPFSQMTSFEDFTCGHTYKSPRSL